MTLFKSEAKLPNGDIIQVGDLVDTKYYMYRGYSIVIEEDGYLTLFGCGPFCFWVSMSHFISQKGEVKKTSLSEIYKECKMTGEKFSWVLNFLREKARQKNVEVKGISR